MNRWQKIAWFNLIVIVAVSAITTATIAVLYLKYGFPKAYAGLGLLGFMGLLGLSPALFRQKKGHVDFDERDMLIHYRSAAAAYYIFFPVFAVAGMIPWFFLGSKTSVSLVILPMMVWGISFFVILVQSIAAIILYGRKGNENE